MTPTTFPLVPLSEVTSKIGSGATPRGGEESYGDAGIPLIRSMNVYDLRFQRDGLAFINEEQAAALDHVTVRSGDVLVNITGASVARCCPAPIELAGARVNQHVAILRPRVGLLDGRFLAYWLVSPDTKTHLLSLSRVGGTREALTKAGLERFLVPLPSIGEQRRIASILGAYDDLIEVNRRRIAVLEEMARRLFEEWFVHFRFPGHDSSSADARTPPRDWPEAAIADVCTWLQAGGTPSRKQPEYWEDGTVDWFTTGELQDCFLFASKERVSATAVRERKARLFPAGTVFMAIYGSPTVGRIGIATAECSSNQAALALWPDDRRIGRWFLVHTLMGLRQHFNAISQGAAQQNISKEKVAAAKFPCPPAGLVHEFEGRVSPVWDLRRTLERQQQKLAASRDLLLPRLISGDLQVTAAERELEAVA